MLNDILLANYSSAYQNAKPFPHIIIDDAFDSSIASRIETVFPMPSQDWWTYNNQLEKKLAFNDLTKLSPSIVNFINYLNSNPFVTQLEKLTGIEGLITDHTLNGGGLHQIIHGGKLDIHADYNYHPITKLDRRINVLIYFNSNWRDEWGGQLEFWDENMTQCEGRISPVFNRMVIFSTTDKSLHGHPEPLQCPMGVTRKSIAMYYYTNGRPKEETTAPHSTLFKRRPCDPISEELDQLREQRGIKRL